jgi:excisionase family DNA binding protein
MEDRMLTLPQVAERLQVPLSTLYSWRYQGQGPPAYRMGRSVRVRESELEAWIQAQAERRSA